MCKENKYDNPNIWISHDLDACRRHIALSNHLPLTHANNFCKIPELEIVLYIGGRNPIEALPGFELLAEGDGPRLGARIQEEALDSSSWLRPLALSWAQESRKSPNGFFTLYPRAPNGVLYPIPYTLKP